MSIQNLKWKAYNVNGKITNKGLPGGTDSDGATIYVGRAMMSHETIIPCKVIPDRQRAYVAHNGAEIPVENFEMLIGKPKHYAWVPSSHGNVPENCVSSGTDCGEAIYVGRALFESSMTIGKIHPSHGCIYIPYGGHEVRLADYEALVYTKKPSRREKRKEKRRKRKESTSSSSDSDQGFTPYAVADADE